MTDTKPCLICGATITRTKQGATDWARRSYCSRTCIWAARKAGRLVSAADVKTCTACGKDHVRPAGMSGSKWARRSRCRDCGRREPGVGRCEVCRGPLPRRRIAKLPWCSNPCKAQWKAAHPDDDRPHHKRPSEDTQPPIRLRSELLPDDTPRKMWIDRTPGRVAVCCGHCRRRFPRASIRLAERLLTMHRRTCGSGL